MKIAFNPSTVAALIAPPNNKDITFDLRGHNIFARGVKFCGTDTNTWRDIKINNVSIGSNILDLRNGSNTTLTNTNGVVTINSTWRPVVDNLTSNSTTSSLSANLGRILKALIDGKSDSDHNHDDRYVKKSGDTMLGALNFANGTWNLVGDDVYIGNYNLGGRLCIKSANNDNISGIAIYNKAESVVANLWFDNANLNVDRQFVVQNHHLWIQGVGTAGGDNNRLTLVAGMPSGLAYNTSCRGTILYSNGIAFADPYNDNSNNDSGWIRHLETTPNRGTLEIAVGDDASNEEIHFRWYDTTKTSEHIGNDITVPRATGTLALTSQIPTTLPANGGNSDTVDGYHASGLLTSVTNTNNGVSITVGGTTKSISNISVNYASSAGNADTVDGYHSSDLVKFYLSPMDSGAPADSAKSWFINTMPSASAAIVYNVPGAEKTIIAGKSSGTFGHMLQLNYDDTYLRILRYFNGSWKSTDWEKISAGYADSAGSATKLQTPRTIWGQSFDGTGNVNGTIYINNSDSSNGVIRLNNNINSNARISAINDQVIFNTGAAIRFGETAWDWNQWAGLKYTHSNKTIYLGIADNSIFNANSTLGGGTLNLRAGISSIDLNSGTAIRGLSTDGSPYSSSITLRDTSISLSAYGDISMSTGPGAIELSSGYSGIKLSCLGNNASINPEGFKVEASRGVYLNSKNSGNVYLCLGGGNVSIGYSSPSYKLDVNGLMRSNGFHHYYADSNDYVLLAGGSYLIHKTGSTTWSTAILFGNYVWIILLMDDATSGRQVVPNNIAKPTKNIYVVNIQTGSYNYSRNGVYRIAPDGNLYYVNGSDGLRLYTTICYVAS